MSIIIDKTFLLLYGLFPLFTLPVYASFVLCFFIAICYGSFSCCVTEQKRQVGFCMLYLISMLVFPDSARFLMLPIYDLFRIIVTGPTVFLKQYGLPIAAQAEQCGQSAAEQQENDLWKGQKNEEPHQQHAKASECNIQQNDR